MTPTSSTELATHGRWWYGHGHESTPYTDNGNYPPPSIWARVGRALGVVIRRVIGCTTSCGKTYPLDIKQNEETGIGIVHVPRYTSKFGSVGKQHSFLISQKSKKKNGLDDQDRADLGREAEGETILETDDRFVIDVPSAFKTIITKCRARDDFLPKDLQLRESKNLVKFRLLNWIEQLGYEM